MRNLGQRLSTFFVIGAIFVGFAIQAKAQNRNEVNDIVNQITSKITDFQYNFNSDVNQNSVSQSEEQQTIDLMGNLRSNIENFQNNLNNNSESPNDVRQIIAAANSLNDYLLRLRLNAKTQNDWKSVRSNLDRLAGNYQVATNWNTSVRQVNTASVSNNSLNGTYQIDTNRSDNLSEIIDEALNSSNAQNRDEAKQDLQQKLESPQILAIEIRGKQAVLASTLAPQITLQADGSDQSQTLSDGSIMRIRAVLRGQELNVSKLGSDEDYTVTFTAIDNGNGLKVTRRITTNYLNQTLFTESVYTKSEATAKLDIYENQNNYPANTSANNYPNNNQNNYPTTTTSTTTTTNSPTARTTQIGQYIIPNGEIITATLENPISTKVSQNNDPFRANVIAPAQYRGAVIEGYLTGIDRSNRNPIGKSKVTLNFEKITLVNGQTYDFAGFLQTITNPKGKTIKVDEEGTATKSSTKETLKRGGIGAGAGAIIGAIFGGAKGAVIGATIGAGAGAGTVAIQNNGDLEIEQGSSITIQSSAPGN